MRGSTGRLPLYGPCASTSDLLVPSIETGLDAIIPPIVLDVSSNYSQRFSWDWDSPPTSED